MRIAILFLIVSATSLLAWLTPPTAIFDGRVISAKKVSDVSFHKEANGGLERQVTPAKVNDGVKDKNDHLEIWKAEVSVERVNAAPGLSSNLARVVSVYYDQDSATDFVTPYGVEAGRPSRLRLTTNQVYTFTCCRLDIPDDETNAFTAFDGGIIPK
jgi:hypothetical protein